MSNIKDYSLDSDTLQRDKIRIIKNYLKTMEGSGVADWYDAGSQVQGGNAVLDLSKYADTRKGYVKSIENAYLEYRSKYNKLLYYVNNGLVHIYRAMRLSQQGIQKIIESDLTPPLGIYWTYDQKSAKVWADHPEGEGRDHIVRLEGYVKENNVDWGTSLYYNMNPEFAGEREIRLPSGTPVDIVNVWLEQPLEKFESSLSEADIKKHLNEMYKTWVSDDEFFHWLLSRFHSSTSSDPVYTNVKDFYTNYFLNNFKVKDLHPEDVWAFVTHFNLFELLDLKKHEWWGNAYIDVSHREKLQKTLIDQEDKIKRYMKSNPQRTWTFMMNLNNVRYKLLQGSFREIIKQPWVTEIPSDVNLGFNFQLNDSDRKELKKRKFKT